MRKELLCVVYHGHDPILYNSDTLSYGKFACVNRNVPGMKVSTTFEAASRERMEWEMYVCRGHRYSAFTLAITSSFVS